MKLISFVLVLTVSAAVSEIEALNKGFTSIGESQRLIGGHEAVSGQFPWNAAVHDGRTFLCSAVLVEHGSSGMFLLTSAECVIEFKSDPGRLTVTLGSLKPNAGTHVHKVMFVQPHDKYTRKVDETTGKVTEIYHAFNIAKLYLETDVVLTPNIAPIPMDWTTVTDGTYVQFCGWGDTGSGLSNHLEFAYTETFNVYNCITQIGGNPSVEHHYNLCTTAFNPTVGAYSGACHFDHGAGLVKDYNSPNGPVLVGLVSYGNCDDAHKFPTIYTSIAGHSIWIQLP